MRRKAEKVMLPGDRIRRILTDQNLSQEVFADWIGVSRLTINQIINHQRRLTPDVALRIAAATLTSPDEWLEMQQRVDLDAAREKLKDELAMIQPIVRPHRSRPHR